MELLNKKLISLDAIKPNTFSLDFELLSDSDIDIILDAIQNQSLEKKIF